MIAHDEFAFAGLRNIAFDQIEVAFADGALRTRGEKDLTVDVAHGVSVSAG